MLNSSSSRSHTLVYLRVRTTSTEGAATEGRLAVVDLAGSERLKKSGSSGVLQQEAIAINSSLHALSQAPPPLTPPHDPPSQPPLARRTTSARKADRR